MIPWKVTQMKVLSGYRLEVGFADGLSGVVDLSKERFEGILAPLADETFFARARINGGVVAWPRGTNHRG